MSSRDLAAMRYTGARVKRLEDPPLLQGRGRYVDDIRRPGLLRAMFIRSPHAHAVIRGVDTKAARALSGVVAVVTAADLAAVLHPLTPKLEGGGFTPTTWPALAEGRALFCGQAVAVVVAERADIAADARDAVTVEWEPAPAIATVDAGLAAGEILFRREARRGDVDGAFARAHAVVRETFRHGRLAPVPLESRGMVAEWDGETLTAWASTQSPQIMRSALAVSLGLPESRVRVAVPMVGGGFGLKMQVFPEDVVVAALARLLERPVKWIDERRESFAAASHARGQQVDVEVAADADGRVLAMRSRVVSDAGAYHSYPLTQALEPLGSAGIMPGPYLTPAYAWEAVAVRTHKPPLGAYRGVGMTMGAFVMERALDLLAARLRLDPAELRRRNLIPRESYPFTSASGMTYDSGDFPRALEQALAAADYEQLRREQKDALAQGRCVGIGIGCYTEFTGMGAEVFRRRGMVHVPGIEAARVTMDPDGAVRCSVSFPSQGQGHWTAVAQLIADRLGIALERVVLQPVDTLTSPAGSGTFGSRGMVSMSGTVVAATDVVRTKLERLAAHLLEASPADVVLGDGRASIRGVPDRGIPVAELARLAHSPPLGGLPRGFEPGLEATVYFDPPGPTFSGAVHVAAVEVDVETGAVSIRRYVVAEDCGPIVNPMLVDGQIHGAVAQGIGEALLEHVVHDDEGQLLTGTLMDYALPRATDVPPLAIEHLETPSPLMPGGVKGMGEGGTIGSPAAIANAVADAVRHLGVTITSLPLSSRDLIRRT